MTEPEDEPRGWVQWDDGTWSTLDEYGMPSERQTLDELLDAAQQRARTEPDD
ncbi:hypothetical protein IU440_13755 [Nocardia cyriacigeorgica]|uniref:hypothetical protein n=1 Tax=Nocardia cyriacigeorgica TaxID=135487 RepID=UPI0018951942|nr:hypothetical protein [Nocardia cyriacigeorgica]MBF6425753.1 hypothetical protein [Nocardia cyriacigeorgica]